MWIRLLGVRTQKHAGHVGIALNVHNNLLSAVELADVG